MPFLALKTHTLHYTAVGDATHPSLLLLHGFLGSHRDFVGILPALCDQFYCIVPDLPGHGETTTQLDGYTFKATAQALLALLEALGIARSHLLGYSMGGRLALYLLCYFPGRFRCAVLESASPGLKTAEERRERRARDQAIAQQIQSTPLFDFLTQWYGNPLFDSLQDHPDRYAAMLQRRQHNHPVELAAALCGLSTGQQPSLWEALPNIENPLLLLAGTLDPKFVAISQDMLACAQHNAIFQAITDCGHNIHIEAPFVYAQTVCHFLER